MAEPLDQQAINVCALAIPWMNLYVVNDEYLVAFHPWSQFAWTLTEQAFGRQ